MRKKLAEWSAIALCSMMFMAIGGFLGARIAMSQEDVQYGHVPYNWSDVTFAQTAAECFHDADYNFIEPLFAPIGGRDMSLSDLFDAANPAVVAIQTEVAGRNIFGHIVTRPAAGSGFIISPDGYVVTNNHVIENAQSISILLYDGTVYPAGVVGSDPAGDLAVLKIDAENLAYLAFGDSDLLRVGEQVAAIGNPLGEFANSMTVGHVSALDREINIDGLPLNMLQTDAAVNRGNSGGPLLNIRGEVIGVITAKSGGATVEGLGFAIPSNVAAETVAQIIEEGPKPGRPVLGVTVTTILDREFQTWVRVEHVNPNSGAEAAGIVAGDLIAYVNGTRVLNNNDLAAILSEASPGDTITVVIQRGNEELTFEVVLGESTLPI